MCFTLEPETKIQSCPKCCKKRWTCGDDFLCDDPLLCTPSGDTVTPKSVVASGTKNIFPCNSLNKVLWIKLISIDKFVLLFDFWLDSTNDVPKTTPKKDQVINGKTTRLPDNIFHASTKDRNLMSTKKKTHEEYQDRLPTIPVSSCSTSQSEIKILKPKLPHMFQNFPRIFFYS